MQQVMHLRQRQHTGIERPAARPAARQPCQGLHDRQAVLHPVVQLRQHVLAQGGYPLRLHQPRIGGAAAILRCQGGGGPIHRQPAKQRRQGQQRRHRRERDQPAPAQRIKADAVTHHQRPAL